MFSSRMEKSNLKCLGYAKIYGENELECYINNVKTMFLIIPTTVIKRNKTRYNIITFYHGLTS